MKFDRVFTIVLDSVGIGAAKDASSFDDVGADTLGHVGQFFQNDLKIPNLVKLGLGNIRKDNPMPGIPVVDSPMAYYGKMQEVSAGKDSLNGHWEMMGLPLTESLGFFPNGFPQELIDKIEKFSGRKVIVNKPYSGTQVIHDYGEMQMQTGDLIVYTSGDSVLQVAAHEDVIPLEELYRICEYVRSITIDDYKIGRIIARPYKGTNKENFVRTSNRHDYTLPPIGPTVMDELKDNNFDVLAVGKTNDIFSGKGITSGEHTVSNSDGMDKTIENQQEQFNGFCFTNLVDFDAKFGHRRDVEGFGNCLMDFDKQLGVFLDNMKATDLLIITADHGNDPGFRGTDHTRENVPLLAYSPSFENQGQALGVRQTFADLGATIAQNFDVENVDSNATSFFNDLK